MAAQAVRVPPALQLVRLKGQVLVPLPTFLLCLVLALLLSHGIARRGQQSSGVATSAAGQQGQQLAQQDGVGGSWLNRANDSWPVSRTLQCGNGDWQRDYARLHAKMLRREAEPRYIVAHGENGLADSLVGAVTLFWVAVLQRRAFFMTFGDSRGRYEWAFDQPNINWTWDKRLLDEGEVLKFRLDSRKPNLTEPMTIRFGDVRQLGKGYTTLYINTFKGYTWPLLDNTHHKEELRAMGLHPSNAFACAVDFLFRVRPEALEPHLPEVEALTAPKTLKIGMHIRVGDRALVKGQDSSRLEFYAAFFDCARQLERHRGARGRTVKYFLLSDSMRLRKLAAEAYGDKLITTLGLELRHTRRNRYGDLAEVIRGFQSAAAEMWMLGLTDYQVITTHSGYGRLGSFMSGKYHQVYGVELWKDQKEPPENISCGVDDYMNRWNM